MRSNSQLVGNAGLYFVCYRLSLLGWNVMPTARNAKGIDVVAYSQNGSRFLGVQVKALSKRAAVPVGGSLDGVMGDFWIVVNKVASESPGVFVLKPDEVRQLSHGNEKDGRVSYWLEPRSYETEDFRDAWGRIGTGDS